MLEQHNLGQWLRDPMTEKLLAFFEDRKKVITSMIVNGTADYPGYKMYSGEWKGLHWLDIFITEQRKDERDGS